MNTRKNFVLFASGGALALFGGCASGPDSHLVTAPPPSSPTTSGQPMVVTQPQQVVMVPGQQVAPGTVNSYIVVQAPPAPQAPEAVPLRPTGQHAWIAGYWTWRNNRYEWMAGHWEVPPYAAATWMNPRWEPEGGAFRFYEGYWK